MNAKEIAKMQTENVLLGWSKQGGLDPIVVDHAEGIYIYDTDGKRYADMSSEQVNVNAGYANKEMTEAIKAHGEQKAVQSLQNRLSTVCLTVLEKCSLQTVGQMRTRMR